MSHTPFSELTKDWSNERKARNKAATDKLLKEIEVLENMPKEEFETYLKEHSWDEEVNDTSK